VNALRRKWRRFQELRDDFGLRPALTDAGIGLRASVQYRLLAAGRRLRLVSDATWKRYTDSFVPWGVTSETQRYPAGSYLPARPCATAAQAARPAAAGAPVAVIVPVYRGLDQTRACVESLQRARTDAAREIVLVDDATPEPELKRWLDGIREDVTLLRNSANQGFVASVNRGMDYAAGRDVVLLNSDTLVADGWLDRLRAHAWSGDHVGTVTPLSNNATICSYPDHDGWAELPEGESVASIAGACAEANLGRAVELPTAVGFCMYVRRDCLDEVGAFDVESFGTGYGEENDFCRRALARGWHSVLATDVFVWHEGEVSFGGSAEERRAAAMDVLTRRYPDYLPQVESWARRDPARPFRAAVTAARYRRDRRPVVLMVTHDLGGGTERHIRELCDRFREDARFLVLRPLGGAFVTLSTMDPRDRLHLVFEAGRDEPLLARLLQSFGVARLHVHHVMHLSTDLRALLRSLAVPFDVTVHDFFALCPRVRFTIRPGVYCGGPEPAQCRGCLRHDRPHGARDIRAWHRKHAWLFEEAARVICPSADTAARVETVFPGARCLAVPHHFLDRDPPADPVPAAPALTPEDPLRIAVLGALSCDKGRDVVIGLARATQAAASPLHLTVIGHLPANEQVSTEGISTLRFTGEYGPEDLPRLWSEAAPHLVWFPAQWPETYSYTLSEAFAAGLPVVATSIGAFPERLSGRPWSWLAPVGEPVGRLHERFLALREAFLAGSAPEPPSAPAPHPISPGFYGSRYLEWARQADAYAHAGSGAAQPLPAGRDRHA